MTAQSADPRQAARLPSSRRIYNNLKDEAADFIREGILSGALPARSKIDQDEVADALGISRAPVREALIELTQKGFVAAVPRHGAFVSELTVEDIEDYYEVVAPVLGVMAKRAVGRLTAADVAELRGLHEEINATGDLARRKVLVMRFFIAIATAGRSSRLDSIFQMLGGMFQGSFYSEAPEWTANELSFRQSLLGAIESGDERAAARISEEYVRTCAVVTIGYLRDRGYWAS